MKHVLDKYRQSMAGGKKIAADKVEAWVKAHFEVKPRKGGTELRICSPFTDDTKFKFNINPEKNYCHDWTGDEWAGPPNPKTGKRYCSFLKFVKLYLKCSYTDAVRAVLGATEDIGSYLRPETRQTSIEAKEKVSVALPSGLESLAISTDRQAHILKRWLYKRGYTDEIIAANDLYYLGLVVYWPYYEFDELVYWQSRAYINKKFAFPPSKIYDENGEMIAETDVTKSDFLYGFDNVEPASYIIITEAIFDQATLNEQALASGGAILTNKQIGKISILGPRKGIILSPDNDKAGIKSIIANYELIFNKLDVPIFYSIPPKKYNNKKIKDWNELVTECKLQSSQVRLIHDNNIRKLTPHSIIELKSKILELK